MTFGLLVEGSVAILLAVTIGYCVVLNARLKRLHGDRDALRQMVGDLVQATNLANAAIKELKVTAIETDQTLNARLEEAERFGVELASHINAGQALMERVAKFTSAARHSKSLEPEPRAEEPSLVKSALQALATHERMRGNAA
ncbi:DUF6468 domain-containing protein [Paradevosia shaoguanensis]|uniref:DUF6468 domain-containing protein n=1 Tax=Paradevosia shaoguanensis TaxID=1335043 RepID=A0AA41UBY8_9HYPH|nr:DUF6468 domain-containing protein [Paradevosia shaoguanensis]KFL28751.1 hypothetical protein JP74_02440 [Devosia sp. 17-2-E-8]MCF1743179.1 DUF6468 domain-containing protein [Paradevosia shaoguanensis]MCI0127662.1 DUF6468 domain-containing protein [Paradevosia shaoguanensis]CDP50384.1 bll5824; hypothetical protein [Devosia sp. DBB001]